MAALGNPATKTGTLRFKPEVPTDDLAMPAGLIEPFALQNVFCDGMVIVPGVNGDVLHFLGYAEYPSHRDGDPRSACAAADTVRLV